MDKIAMCKVQAICDGTSTTSATATHIIDTIGCSKAHIYVLSGTQTTTSHVWADISVFHGTNTSATTLISAASWATAATTAAENVIPAAATAGLYGSCMEIHLDLTQYDRYLNVYTTRGATPTANANGALMVILEPNESADNTTTKRCNDWAGTTNLQTVGTVVVS
jgi:hypothetical protein